MAAILLSVRVFRSLDTTYSLARLKFLESVGTPEWFSPAHAGMDPKCSLCRN